MNFFHSQVMKILDVKKHFSYKTSANPSHLEITFDSEKALGSLEEE